MIVFWVAVYVLAGIGLLGLVAAGILAALVALDAYRMRREQIWREGKPLSGRERRELARLEREVNSSGS